MTKDFKARKLIKIENFEEYDGTTAVVATQHLEPEEIEYERWKRERWMKSPYTRRHRKEPCSCSVTGPRCWPTLSAEAACDRCSAWKAPAPSLNATAPFARPNAYTCNLQAKPAGYSGPAQQEGERGRGSLNLPGDAGHVVRLSSAANRRGQVLEQFHGFVPADAGIRDALAVASGWPEPASERRRQDCSPASRR